MGTTRHSYYISSTLEQEGRICQVRDQIFENIHTSIPYKKSDPHITIVPPFQLSSEYEHELRQKVNQLDLSNRAVNIRGTGIWPSLEMPRVILLDVELDVSQERDELVSWIQDRNGSLKYDPVRPHITLFKCDDLPSADPFFQKQLQEQLMTHREQWRTRLQYTDLVQLSSM